MKKWLKRGLLLLLIFWLPLVIAKTHTQLFYYQDDISQLDQSDAVIIFGTLVRNGHISDLLKQRLDTGIAILKQGKANTIVVSNTPKASQAMKTYLLNQGIPESLIEMDVTAERTPDSCRYEKSQHPKSRRLIFVSQNYHLARIVYQCRRLKVSGVAFPADAIQIVNAPKLSMIRKVVIRTQRHIRESVLLWLSVLHIYN
ncbi:MAG: YdcF family protein [Thiotrichaceae bacterium]